MPIEAIAADIVVCFREGRDLVLRAEPGAGKTTRVPPLALEAGCAGEIVCAQPRRLAARLAAARVAETLGEEVGRTCGYQVRFESKLGPTTRIRFVTEGILTRRLRDDPELRGVGMVVLDEFHERHLDGDLALALVRRLQRERRPDLRIVVMSATIDPGPIARWLGATALECAGRPYPVVIEHVERASDRPLGTQVAAAVRTVRGERAAGSVLVFLPGAREIRECASACEPVARELGLEVVALHGDLPADAQDRAVRPGPRDKLILSTNVAETSVTIEGVTAVVDSGLARRASVDPWSGLQRLELGKISRASAEQRAGRAGRTGPGRCLRLYPRHDFDRRPAFASPEIARLDLTGALLDLRAAGIERPAELDWLEPPPPASLRAGEDLLARLHAVDHRGALTDTGREMLRYPLHPRLAAVLVDARRRGIPRLGARAAALLGERAIRRAALGERGRPAASAKHAAAADVLVDLDALDAFAKEGSAASRLGLDASACRTVQQATRALLDQIGRAPDRVEDPEDALCQALLRGYPDRVARVHARAGAPTRLVLVGGGEAQLAAESATHGAELLVALQAEHRKDGTHSRVIVRSAAHIEPTWLLDAFPERISEHAVVAFDPERERVDATLELRYDDLVIDATVARTVPPEASDLLRKHALARPLATFVDDADDLALVLARTDWLATRNPGFPRIDEGAVREVLATLCEGRRSFTEVRAANLLAHTLERLDPVARARLEREAPAFVTLGGGRRVRVHYAADRPPWIESRLQDFFGSATGPKLPDGTPLVLHLLAPNGRAVQVTTDLAGFWTRQYPASRKELMRRYPRHDWPEDPRTAKPPAPRRR